MGRETLPPCTLSPAMTVLVPDLLAAPAPHDGAVYGVGTFDGVHRGHLHLIDTVIRIANDLGLPAWVLVLYRDPTNPLFFGRQVITTLLERNVLFSETKIAGACTLSLVPSLTNLSHESFVRDILLDRLAARHLVVGWDFHYGHSRVGNVTLLEHQLQHASQRCGLTILDPVMDGNEPIKSTTIREWLTTGALDKANAWLTRPYFAMGTVVEGRRQGQTLGFPTANLALPDDKLRPAHGVYITRAEVASRAGEQFWAATNVGQRPTIGGDQQVTVEAHLLDFTGNLYGEEMTLHFLHFLRPEGRFPDLATLSAQIGRDVAAVREYAASPGR